LHRRGPTAAPDVPTTTMSALSEFALLLLSTALVNNVVLV
jgi:hypothetical protein